MQTPGINSSSYYQKLWENFASELEGSSNQTNKSPKNHTKIVERQNERCEICYQMAKKKLKGCIEPQNGKEEDIHKVVEENVIVINDDNEEERNEILEKKIVRNGNVEGGKREVMKEKMMLAMEKCKADEEEINVSEEKIAKNCELVDGKVIIIDEGVDMEPLLTDIENNVANEGGEENGNDGVTMGDFMENENGDLFSAQIIEEDDPLSSWIQWRFGEDRDWDCGYPFWEIDNSSFNFCDAEPPAND